MSVDKYPPPDDRWIKIGKNAYILPRDKMTKEEKSNLNLKVNKFKTKKIIKSIMDDLIEKLISSNQNSSKENNGKERWKMEQSKLKGNDKRIMSCKLVGGHYKKEGHKKEETFNDKYNPKCKTLTMKPESDCQISEDNQILDELIKKDIIKDKKERNTSNKSGGSIQLTLGNIPELNKENNLGVIQNKEKCIKLFEKYLKKCESDRPADLLVYDTGKSRLFFNMDIVIDYIVKTCVFRKLGSGRIKGDFIDKSSRTGKRALLTYEYRKNHKSYFLGFSGGQGKHFIELLKTNIKYHEEPY